MNRFDRQKLIAWGFDVFRKDERTRVITRATEKGGWARVAKTASKKELKQLWDDLMLLPKAIGE